ncbi:hypothetical protein EYF80_009296 [Liparis tanakae]|uniref:Uncharacterized protein n=1 Tax=Liparis tanakae TaxID=230148 RepID=A0A4Z2IRW8_9TELE|nr:hypothetical protein EYF80_009296 [Liparis tanakae]
MSVVPVLLRLVDLPEERGAVGGEAMGGVAGEVWLFIVLEETLGVDTRVWPGEGAEDDVLVVQDEENKGVCVEAVVVQGLEAERED